MAGDCMLAHLEECVLVFPRRFPASGRRFVVTHARPRSPLPRDVQCPPLTVTVAVTVTVTITVTITVTVTVFTPTTKVGA